MYIKCCLRKTVLSECTGNYEWLSIEIDVFESGWFSYGIFQVGFCMFVRASVYRSQEMSMSHGDLLFLIHSPTHPLPAIELKLTGAGRNSQCAWVSQSYLLQILRALVSTEITGCRSGNDLKRIWKVTLMLHLQFMTFWGKKLHLTSWNSHEAIVHESGGSIFIPQGEQSDYYHLHS